MSALFMASYILLWLFVLVTFVLVLLIYRQYGLMYMTNRQRINLGGLDIGKKMPALGAAQLDGGSIGWGLSGGPHDAGTFVFLATKGCSVCEHLRDEGSFVTLPERLPTIRFVWIDSDPEICSDNELHHWERYSSTSLGMFKTLDVPATPFAYVCDARGVVRGKGLINHTEEAEQLVRSNLVADLLQPSSAS